MLIKRQCPFISLSHFFSSYFRLKALFEFYICKLKRENIPLLHIGYLKYMFVFFFYFLQIIKPNGNVNSCPVTKKTWEERAQANKAYCGGESLYHCLPDYEGNKWEKCVPKTLISEGELYFTPFSRNFYTHFKNKVYFFPNS